MVKQKSKFTKARDGVKKTPLKDCTAEQLQQLFRTVYIKYVVTLEDQLQEDKSHLLLKENTIQILQEDVKFKNRKLRDIEIYEKKKVKKLNKDWSDREALHDAQIFILRDRLKRVEKTYIKKLTEQKENYQKEIDHERAEALKINNDVMAKNDDCIKKNEEILKDHHEITRAYNGLHSMGKFAESEGIDITKHTKQLPENMEFYQSHKLMESGKVKHVYGIKKRKKDKNGK